MARVLSHRTLLGAIGTLVIACGASASPALAWQEPVTDAEPAPSVVKPTCAPIMVYATRGSSENGPTYYQGLGEELTPMWRALRDVYNQTPYDTSKPAAGQATPVIRLFTNRAPKALQSGEGGGVDPAGTAPGGGYRSVGVDYKFPAPAETIVSAYEASVKQGVAAAIRDLKLIHETCRDAKLVVMGYSEGAEITRRAQAALTWAAGVAAPTSVFTMIFGDVLWGAHEGIKYVGDTATSGRGIIRTVKEGFFGTGAAALVPAIPNWKAEWNVTSWCHGGDLACQAPGGSTVAHTTYKSEDQVGAPFRAAQYTGGTFLKPVITAKLSVDTQCFAARSYKETANMAGSPAGSALTVTSSWEGSLGNNPFPTMFVTAAGGDVQRTVDGATIAGVRFVAWLGTKDKKIKLDYRNRC